MAEVLVIGKKISEMGLVSEITGEEKIPTGVVGDKAVTTGQLLTYLDNNGKVQWGHIEGDITNQADLQNQFEQQLVTLQNHIQDQGNPHNVTKDQVGLGLVDNTSDMGKPVSTAVQEALSLKADQTYVDDSLANKTHNSLLGRDADGAHPAVAILDVSGKSQQEVNNLYIDTSADLFSMLSLTQMVGSRVSTRDNSGAWDVVPFGTGDFDHGGVGLKIPSVFSGGMIPITAFGGVSDYNAATKSGTPVDTAFNRLMAFCERTGATAQIVGKFYSKGGMKISKPVRIYANAEIYCDNSDNNIALEIGTTGTQFSTNGGSARLKMEGRLDLRKIRNAAGQPFWWDNTDTTSIGSLEHALHGCSFGGFSVDGFNQNRVWESSGTTGYANTNNFDCRCTNGRNNVIALVGDRGYVNENRWFAGLITNTSSTPLTAADTVVSISLNSAAEFFCDNNQFIGVNIEDHSSAKVLQTNGHYNIIQNCRLEGVRAQSIHFGVGSQKNRVDQCLGIENGKFSSKVLDEGDNNFSGVGSLYQNSYSSYGVYMGANNSPAEGGGLGRYSVFGSMHKTDGRYLATAVGQRGIGVWKVASGLRDFPAVWIDAETGRLNLGFGEAEPATHLRGRTGGVDILLGSDNGTLGMGGLVMGGHFDKGHLAMRSSAFDYHLYVDGSGNLRFAKTAQNEKPLSATDGVIVATAP